MYIELNPFSINYKEIVMDESLELAYNVEILKDIKGNYSYERGFELPFTPEWIDKLKNDMSNILSYHNMRQLRFHESNNMIIGLRCKDNMNYWNLDELIAIQTIVNNVSKNLMIQDSHYYTYYS